MTTKRLEEGRVYWRTRVRDTTRLLAFDPRSLRTISIRHSFAIVSLSCWKALPAPRRTISTRKRRRNGYFDITYDITTYSSISSIPHLEENIGKYNIIYITKILFRNLLSKSRSLLSLFPINWSLLHELNYIYAKFRINYQLLIYIEPVYMVRVIYWTCFAIKRDCLITDATNSESTRPLIPSSRGQIPRNQGYILARPSTTG